MPCMLQIDGMISATYDDFLSVVARGRGLSKEAVRVVAKGRVWSGNQAMEVRHTLVAQGDGQGPAQPYTCIRLYSTPHNVGVNTPAGLIMCTPALLTTNMHGWLQMNDNTPASTRTAKLMRSAACIVCMH